MLYLKKLVKFNSNPIPKSIKNEIENLKSNKLFYLLGVLIAASHIAFNSIINIDTKNLNIFHFSSFILLAGLFYAPKFADYKHSIKKYNFYKKPVLLTLHYVFVILVMLSALAMTITEDLIYARGVELVLWDYIFGTLVVIGAIEFTRKTTGWIIPLLIIFSLSYITFLGPMIEGFFSFKGLTYETAMFRSLMGDDGIFGNIARISSTFVFVFIIFGAFLLRSGAGDFVIKISSLAADKLVGGAGIVAVIGSALTGTISGSAIANTASTGVITIPMMIKAGFSRKFAASVEAVASTGGQLAPPVMGAGAFIMASYTQIPYQTIVLVSILPALLFFISLAIYIRVEAYKSGIILDKQTLDNKIGQVIPKIKFKDLMQESGINFIIPVIVLVYLLIDGYSPTYAGIISIMTIVIVSWFSSIKLDLRAITDALALASKNMITTAILLCSVGLIVNAIITSGLGNSFSLMIVHWADNSILIAFVLIALASLILGMGLPVTASYIVLATLSAPALYDMVLFDSLLDKLVNSDLSSEMKTVISLTYPDILNLSSINLETAKQIIASLPKESLNILYPSLYSPAELQIYLLIAHLVIFWLSQDSNVTPPVCLCTFTAAAIAKTHPIATGFVSWRLAKGLYIIPLLFIYTPLISGDFMEIMLTFIYALFGLSALIYFAQGYAKVKLNAITRIIIFIYGVALLYPLETFVQNQPTLILNLIKIAIILLFICHLWIVNKNTK